MEANEYIKKYGVDCAKEILKHNQDLMGISFFIGLKRLVESHELIESCGGIHMARADVMDLDGFEKTSPYWMKIKQAILDVESCQ